MHTETGNPRSYAIAGTRLTAPPLAPGLHILATPIGNLADVSLRALATLAACERIYCEDTRMTRRLLDRYDIRTPLSPYHDHNAAKMRPLILEALAAGAALVQVSDAGTPLVSDPGYKLARAAMDAGLKVHMVPGPSAPVSALVLSGLPPDRFLFAGFLPVRDGERRRVLAEFTHLQASLIFFETAPRLEASLAAIAEVLPGRSIAIARELTKLHEEVLRGTAESLLAELQQRGTLKGEITLVISPPPASEGPDAVDLDAALREALTRMSLSQAASAVAGSLGLPRRDVYARALALKGEQE